MNTASKFLNMLMTSCMIAGCANEAPQSETSTPPKIAPIAQTAENWGMDENEFWGVSDNDPASPYVLWLKIGSNSPCHLPVLKTGYPTFPGLQGEAARRTRIRSMDGDSVDVCPALPDRCYFMSRDWMPSNLRTISFSKDEACDPNLKVELMNPK